ncbi:type 4 pilus major pilin [Azospirillum sp. B4]|uniref:type 4 pilus major pilin n=1 Tax=Azospirillum sp. B4 TaxID=95605 RepID=UPI00034661CC|nr:type 4 pilus major pilin [Azospirillum sp. B4]
MSMAMALPLSAGPGNDLGLVLSPRDFRQALDRSMDRTRRSLQHRRQSGSLLLDAVLAIAIIGFVGSQVWEIYASGDTDKRVSAGNKEVLSVFNGTTHAFRGQTAMGAAANAAISSATILKTHDVLGSMNVGNADTTIVNQFGGTVTASVGPNIYRQFYIDYPNVPEAECNGMLNELVPGAQVVSVAVGTTGTARIPGGTLTPDQAKTDCVAAATAPVTLHYLMQR